MFRSPLTEEAFFRQGLVAVVLGHAQSFAEQELAALGHPRRIEITVSSFLAVPWMLAHTRRLAVMHERLAKILVKKFPLAMRSPAIRIPAHAGDDSIPQRQEK